MWNKLSNAFTKSSAPRSSIDNDSDSARVDLMTRIHEQQHSEVPFPSPPSPSKNRKTIFKRSKLDLTQSDNNDRPASPFHLPGLSNKVKSSLRIHTNTSEISLPRPSQDSLARPSLDKTPSTPFSSDHPGRYGSVRSILRDRNTPATGQSVRFFSRDASKSVSPDSNTPSTEQEESSFFSRLGKNSAPARSPSVRPSARDVFASQADVDTPVSPTSPANVSKSHALNSLMMPIPPPDLSNIFDMSQEQDIPIIAPATQSAMLDNAVELSDDTPAVLPPSLEDSLLPLDDPPSTSTPYRPAQETIYFSTVEDSGTVSNSSKSGVPLPFARPVFHLPRPASDSSAPSLISDKRSSKSSAPVSEASMGHSIMSHTRTLSDTVLHAMIRSASNSSRDTPQPDANNSSDAVVVYSASAPEPDPFRANATTYYTPGTMLPPSPPQHSHIRKASREEDMIWSLRTQLALQHDLCAQYEIDLHARDELVNSLNEKLESVEKEKQHRNSVLRGWKKKVQELERMCRGLEEEVDRSRQESLERSVMDEASSDALRELHRVIGRLEREKADVERRESSEKDRRDIEVEKLKAELTRCEEKLREGIKDAMDQTDVIDKDEHGKAAASEEHYRLVEFAWAEERANLVMKISSLEKQNVELRQDAEKKGEESNVLKVELEAQWKQTESMTANISNLEKERNELKMDVAQLEKRIADIEVEWNEGENKKAQLEAELHGVVSAKSELEEQLQAEATHTDSLTQALHESEEVVHELQNERQSVLDNVARLEETLRQQDAKIADLSQRIVERQSDAEQLKEDLNKARMDRGRDADEQVRTIQEVTFREGEARKRVESLVAQKAESDVLTQTLRERITALNEELERLRRQVHDLQQESADKEVKLTQFGKLRDQDKEDIRGLNIALDSKQQELELLKRKSGVRGTAGSTPAPVKRKESSMFATPTVIRPPSALSDASKDGTRDKKTPDTLTMSSRTLTKSVRVNAAPSATGVKLTRQVEGSKGAPPSAIRGSRPSISGASTRLPSSHGRTSSGTPGQPAAATKPTITRRASSAGFDSSVSRSRPSEVAAAARGSSPVLNEHDEKENSQPIAKVVTKRASMLAV